MEANSESWYRALFETTLDGIMIVDDEGRFVDVNESMCQMLQTPREALIGAQFRDYIPPERLEAATDIFNDLKRVGTFTGEFPLRAADGSIVDLEWRSRAHFVPGRHFCVARDISERKLAESELRRKQEELSDFVENAAIGLHWVGPDGTILWANRAELELLGTSRDEYIGHNIAEFHADEPAIQDILQRLTRKEELHSYEARLRCKDGSIRYVLISSNVLWDGDRFVHTRFFTRDITERRQAEQEVERQREWLKTTLSSIGDAVIATDHSGAITFMNQVAERLTGWSQAEAEARPLPEVFRIINEQTGKPAANPVEKVLQTGRVVGLANHTILIARDGREHAIDDSAAPIQDGSEVVGVVLIFRDISERRRLEIDTRRLAAIVESSDDAIVSKDLNGIVTSWNKAAERIFGYTAEEMVGEPIARLVPADRPDEEPAILNRLRQGERIDHYETIRVRKDGVHLDISVTISPVRDADGHIIGASKVARDITQEKALRYELERRVAELAEADRRKDHFLAMLAHELRNPLGAISNAVHVLQQPQGSEATKLRAVQVLRRQVQHQARMVNELLDVSRITRGLIELHLEQLDLVRLARDAAEDYRASLEQERIALDLELPEGPLWVWADPTRLAQVVSNLFSNALKFTTAGGRVTVAVQPGADPSRVVLTVADTGIGIERELLPHVFESFSQGDRTLARSRGGLGLGLAIVKGLVELHGGEVQVDSAGQGQGTTVRIMLPRHVVPVELPRQRTDPELMGKTLRVLVVEDHRDAAEMLRDLLELNGFEVQVALTGAEGVRAAREYHPDVILCDLGLPGMDGYEVAAALRMAPGGARQRLVAVTGYGQDEDRRRSREAGFQYHLVKPIDPEELREVLLTLADDMGA
jgi:PAS domain S-box-containing protein